MSGSGCVEIGDVEGKRHAPGLSIRAVRKQLDETLRRKLGEELGLQIKPETEVRLVAVQDQMVSRPGPTAPPRMLHPISHVPVKDEQQAGMAVVEHGGLGAGQIVRRPRSEAARLHLLPAVKPLLARWDGRSPAASLPLGRRHVPVGMTRSAGHCAPAIFAAKAEEAFGSSRGVPCRLHLLRGRHEAERSTSVPLPNTYS
jgi:hypothetical protein